MSTEFQVGPFEPIRFYDAPQVFVTQMLNGSASFRSMLDTFILDEARLSAKQRDNIVNELKERSGNTPVGNALVDVVTNPFVWMGFMFSPAGGAAALQSGRIFAQFAKDTPLPHVLKTGWQMLRGTAGGQALHAMNRNVQDLAHAWNVTVTPAEQNLARALGITPKQWLKPDKIRDTALQNQVKRLQRAIRLRLGGEDLVSTPERVEFARRAVVMVKDPGKANFRVLREITDHDTLLRLHKEARDLQQGKDGGIFFTARETKLGDVFEDIQQEARRTSPRFGRPELGPAERLADAGTAFEQAEEFAVRLLPKSEGGVPVVLKGQRQGAIVTPQALDAVLSETPEAYEYIAQVQKASQERFLKLFAREGVTLDELTQARAEGPVALRGLIDETKLVAIAEGYKRKDKMAGKFLYESAVGDFLDPSTLKGVRQGTIEGERLTEAMKEAFVRTVNLDRYFPRNTVRFWSYEGDKLKVVPEELLDSGKRADAITASGRVLAREVETLPYDGEELDEIREMFGAGPGWGREKEKATAALQSAFDARRPAATWTFDLHDALGRYERQTARDHSLFVLRPDAGVLAAQREVFADGQEVWRHHAGNGPLERNAPVRIGLMREMTGEAPIGGWRMAHVLEQTGYLLGGVAEPGPAKELFEDTLVPAALGTLHRDHAITRGAIGIAQTVAHRMVNSPFGEMIERTGGDFGKDLVHQMRVFGDRQLTDPAHLTPGFLGGVAGYLYSTHLGANLSSVLLNLQQPFLHLSAYVGGNQVMKAYPDVFQEMGRYFKNRQKLYGSRAMLTPAERRVAIFGGEANGVKVDAAFEFPEQVDLMGHVLEDLDRLAFEAGGNRTGSVAGFVLRDLPLKLFEKAEWVNRLAAVHATKHAYLASGQLRRTASGAIDRTSAGYAQFLSDAEQMVQETQFGSNFLNTPQIFMRAGGLNEVLSNPLIRQFQTFALRAPLTFVELGSTLRKGTREFGLFPQFGGPVLGEAPWWIGDSFRMLGTSAFIYEVAKNAAGVDVSKGGAVSAFTDIIGGERFVENESIIPQPPIVSIGVNFARGALGGDATLLGNSFARSIPGGVALQRALGVLPQIDESVPDQVLADIPGVMQKTYADWKNPAANGSVPVFKGSGELVDYREPWRLVFQGLGVDIESHRHAGDMAHWLTTQRDQITAARREVLNALLANNPAKAARIKAQFERKFGIPLTVTRDQLKARIRNRTVPRLERLLDRTPKEMRPVMKEVLARTPEVAKRLNTPTEALLQAETSRQRDALTSRQGAPVLTEESLKELRRLMQAAEGVGESLDERSFSPFGGF